MRALSCLIFATALMGCERVAADRADAQLVARVNGIEISAHQIRTGGAPSVAQAVEKVIDLRPYDKDHALISATMR